MMHDSEFRKYFLPGRINIILYTGRGRRGNDLSETRRSSISQESVFVPGGDCGGFTENAILSLCSLCADCGVRDGGVRCIQITAARKRILNTWMIYIPPTGRGAQMLLEFLPWFLHFVIDK